MALGGLLTGILNGVVAPIVKPVNNIVGGVTRVLDGVVLGATSTVRDATGTLTETLEKEPKKPVKPEDEMSPKTTAAGLAGSVTTVVTWLWERVSGKPLPFIAKWVLAALVPYLVSFAASDRRRK